MKKLIAVVFLLTAFFSRSVFADSEAERTAEEKIRGYGIANSIDEFDKAELGKIHDLLTACADVMEFDVKNPDFDTLMVYILHSHNNFRLLTDIDTKAVEATPQPGHDEISLVGGDYIDYIVKNVFALEPEHPPVGALAKRGYCYSGGYYYYTDKFFYYSTDELEIKAVYDLSGGVYYIVFTDVYTENDISEFEYSYAVIQTGGDFGYRVLRIGMGLEPLSEDEVLAYAPDLTGSAEPTPKPETDSFARYRLPLLLAAVSFGISALVIGLIFIVKETRDS